MERTVKPTKKTPLYGLLIPGGILLISLMLSLTLWVATNNYLKSQAISRFNTQASNVTDAINNRFTLYTNGLYGIKGLFNASNSVEVTEWYQYLDALQVNKNYPGATGFALIRYVTQKDIPTFLQTIKAPYLASTAASITIVPNIKSSQHYFYQYVGTSFNPASASAVLGYDLGLQPTRLAALEHARDTGMPTGTGLVLALTGNKTKNFLTYLPIYQHESLLRTEKQRQDNIFGFIQVSLQTEPFFKNILSELTTKDKLNVEVYDSSTRTNSHLLFDTDNTPGDQRLSVATYLRKNIQLPVVQRSWNLYFQAAPDFGLSSAEKALPDIILTGSIILSLSISITLYILLNARNRAQQVATQMTHELRESETKLQAILDNMAEGLVVTEKNGKLSYVNKTAEEMTGMRLINSDQNKWLKEYSLFHIDKKTPFEFEDFPSIKALKGEKTKNIELYLKENVKNEGVFISVNGNPLLDEKGKVTGSIAVFNDITERKNAEITLQAEKAKAEAILSSIGDGVFAINKNEQIILFNKTAEEMTGFSQEEAIGKNYKEVISLVSEDKHEPENKFITTALHGMKAIMPAHTILINRSKEEIPVGDSAAPIIGIQGEITGTVVIFRDISKERELEKLKDEFLSIASHELRTPMTAIKGLISMIFEGDYGKISDNLKKPLGDVATSTNRLIALVNDLLNVSRIEAGRMKFNLAEVSLNEIINQVIATLQPLTKEKGIFLKNEKIPSDTVQGDINKIQEILNNVIGNALKFTDKGSIDITAIIEGQLLKIFIKDTGIGISSDNQIKLFGKFQQVTSQKDGKPQGTGLGLYISRQLAQKMGGDLWIKESEEGKGTTFAFALPLANSAKAATIKKELEEEAEVHIDQK